MIKRLINWIKGLFSKKINSTKTVEKIVEKPTKKSTHEVRLARYKQSTSKKVDSTSNQSLKTYSRAYTRFQENKTRLQRKYNLQQKGLKEVLNTDGSIDVVSVQPPYNKNNYKSLDDYNRFLKGFNYKQQNK